MTQPEGPTAEQPVPAPSVTTAPAHGAPSRWNLSRIPSHLGRARTSTVVLGVLFLGIGALWLNIRPDEPGATTTSDTGTVQPATPTTPPPAPETTAEPTPETTAPQTTSAPSTSAGPTSTDLPLETTTPEEPAPDTSAPTSVSPPTRTPTPTVVSPPG